MLASFESLELLLAKNPPESIFAYGSKSPLKDVLINSVDKNHLIEIGDLDRFHPYMNDREILENTEILTALKASGIKTLFLSNVTSEEITKKANDLGISIITVESSLQDKFEDKIFFHNLLSKNNISVPFGGVVKDKAEVIKNYTIPYVVQDPASYGSLGTFIIKKDADIDKIPNVSPENGFLVREYIDGLAYGVTILIGKKNAIVSQIRLQCSLNEYFDRGGGFFFGIQWISYTSLSKAVINNLEESLNKVISVMQENGFTGIANLDFMISGDKIFIIECNPRLSGATWHLANRPELLHGKNFINEYISVCQNGEVSENILSIPKTNYEGCTLDADSLELNFTEKNGVRQSQETAGIFNSELIKISKKAVDWKEHTYFCLPGTPNGKVLTSEKGMGVLLSHEPFFKYTDKEVSLNDLGKNMWGKINRIFL